MIKRLVWMGTGYVAGAASSWWVQRKVKRTAERVLPEAVRNEITNRVGAIGSKAGERVKIMDLRETPIVTRAKELQRQR